MLRLHPDKRAKAADLKHHRWLEDIVVQGEIDVIRRMEQDEAAKKKALESRSRATSRDKEDEEEKKRMAALDQSERDAMKPVDESVLIVNGDEDEAEGEYGPSQPQHAGHHAPILNAPPIPPSAAAKENSNALTNPSGLARALQNVGTNRTQSTGNKGKSNDARQASAGKKGSTSASGKRRK